MQIPTAAHSVRSSARWSLAAGSGAAGAIDIVCVIPFRRLVWSPTVCSAISSDGFCWFVRLSAYPLFGSSGVSGCQADRGLLWIYRSGVAAGASILNIPMKSAVGLAQSFPADGPDKLQRVVGQRRTVCCNLESRRILFF